MVNIESARELCTVIVTVDAPREIMDDLLSHAESGLQLFESFEGFVAGALHRSDDGERIVQYLQWRTRADHDACVADPRWADWPSSVRFMEHVDAGRARVDVRTYAVRATR